VGEVVHTSPLTTALTTGEESPRRDPLTYYRGTFSDVSVH
jgi:hypothetical protein